MNGEVRKETSTSGLIASRGNGDWGRITVRTDGSILLENLSLSNIAIKNCDLVVESGENPIPFADRSNRLSDFVAGSVKYPNEKLHARHTHDYDGYIISDGTTCGLCGKEKKQ